MQTQSQLFAEDADVKALRELLSKGHWLTRRLIMQTLGWTERRVPETAEKMGAEIVRSRTDGFKLTCKLTPEELPIAAHAANEILSQVRRNARYAMSLKRELVKRSAQQIQH